MYRIRLLDSKLIGTVKWVPFVIDLFALLICEIIFPANKDAWLALELLFPCSTVWWGIFYMGEVWQKSPVTELLYAWNHKFQKVVTVKYAIFSLSFSFLHVILAAVVCIPVDPECAKVFLLLLFLECLAFSGLGYLLSAGICDAGWAIILIMCIIVCDYGTQGKLFRKLHFSLYWYDELTFALVGTRLIAAACVMILSFLAGYLVMRRTKGRGVQLFSTWGIIKRKTD